MLTIHHLSKQYDTESVPVIALRDITFSAADHEFVSIVGPSGCGKTTLLKIIAGLIAPSQGQILITPKPEPGAPVASMVFQEQGLFPWMTALDNTAFGLEARGVGRRERRERARIMLARMGLAGFESRYPKELSGGMRQRVSLARAFLVDAPILLMDEPFSALDAQTRLLMQGLLLDLWREHPKTVIYITHDLEEAVYLGDRVLVMSARPGQILADMAIPLGRPRLLDTDTTAAITEVRWKIWSILESEVRSSFSALTGAAAMLR
jgi:NitT/TauT family transport system ATP-binding protein